jgi:hypothetical protein
MRRTWFITRPTRDALSAHADLALAMKEVAGGKHWKGNKALHRALEQKLVEIGLKKGAEESTYGSSGRTWAALARTFGYWYPDQAGRVVIPPVTEAFAAGRDIPANVQKQILCYQLPNAYVRSTAFRPKYEDGYRVMPFRFLLRLLLDPMLGSYLTRDEVALLILPVKRDDQHGEVKKQILYYRALAVGDGRALAEREDLLGRLTEAYDHRDRADTQGIPYLAYVRDSANSHMIIMEAVDADWFERSEGLIRLKLEFREVAFETLAEFDRLYPFSTRYDVSLQFFARHYGLDTGRRKSSGGAGKGSVATKASKRVALAVRTAEEYLKSHVLPSDEELIQRVVQRTGLPRTQVVQALEEHDYLDQPYVSLPQSLIERYLLAATNSVYWKEFEDLTMEIFRKLGVQAIRPQGRSGANIETVLRLQMDDRTFYGGVADCKSGGGFRLDPKLRDLMATSYIPQYSPFLWPDGESLPVRFFGYVVGSEFRGEANFLKIAAKAHAIAPMLGPIDGFVFHAASLLTLLERHLQEPLQPAHLLAIFTSNRIFLHPDDLEQYLKQLA